MSAHAVQAMCFAIAIGRQTPAKDDRAADPWPRRIYALAIYAGEFSTGVGRGMQCDSHEHAQLRGNRGSVTDAVSFRALGRCRSHYADLSAEKGLRAFALIGYSMGGNLVLKLAGELGAGAPPYLKAVVWVSPVMDLAASADALHNVANRVYEWKFLIGLRRRFRRKAELFPAIYSTEGLERIGSLRQFDDQITARYSGFRGADDYYDRASSSHGASHIAVPALILHALDDPFIRMLPSTRAALLANSRVRLMETAHGGHCAFLAPAVGYDGYWAEKMLLDFLLSVTKP